MEKIRDDIQLPTIDLWSERAEASKLIVKACEELGFFKVINHGVPQQIISRMEEETRLFFSKPPSEKQRAGPAHPYGYGCQNIGLNGDMGEVEYLLLQTNPLFISHKSKYISTDPNKFSNAVSRYVEAAKELACELLDLMVEGLWAEPMSSSVLSGLVRDLESDSLLRLNHYPTADLTYTSSSRIGFGPHTDPQILTILRSNGSGGLQISMEDGVWVPVDPHPDSAFCVNVGDVLQAMTNGRFVSVRHRAVVNSESARTSIVYFAAPPLHATISCLEGSLHKPALYRSFTWAEYKKATYTRKLQDSRLNLFKQMNIPPTQH